MQLRDSRFTAVLLRFSKMIRPETVVIFTALLVLRSTASAEVIEVDDFTKPAKGVEYNSKIELGRTIRNDAAVYLVFNATPKFKRTHPTGFDIIGLANSYDEVITSLGESGADEFGNGYWKFFKPFEGAISNVKLESNRSDLFVMRVNQIEQEASFWINPDLSKPEASQPADASNGYKVRINEISHLSFLGRDNADLNYSNIRLYFDGETPYDEIPEPSALLLICSAATGLCLRRRR